MERRRRKGSSTLSRVWQSTSSTREAIEEVARSRRTNRRDYEKLWNVPKL
jgi:hypothetical protein